MCGIAGLIFTNQHRPKDLEPRRVIQRMIQRLRNRGPEAIRIKRLNNDNCWLAHSRSKHKESMPGTEQPFRSESGHWNITFNGEIYNWKDIDNYLLPTGWHPKTECDTERLAEILDRVGIECLHSIDGMFAFGAFNTKTGDLLLARDRFGQKPLYYINNNGITAFASELSALMELSPWIPMKISLTSMSQYFSMCYVPAPETTIEPIKKLEPGQYALVNHQGCLLLDRFFTPSKEGTLCSNDLERSNVQKLHQNPKKAINLLLKESVQATTPKHSGVTISGGVKSTLLASYIADMDQRMGWTQETRNSYTFQSNQNPTNEAKWAQALCKEWGWNHKCITLTDRNLIDAYRELSERMDEPLGDRSFLKSWSQAKAIHPHEKVIICGDGGDELFGSKYYLSISSKLAQLGNEKNWASIFWQHTLTTCDPKAIHYANKSLGIDPMKLRLEQIKVLQAEYQHSPIEFLQIIDLIYNIPDHILAQANRANANHGIESRWPFLNTKLALAALALKPNHLVQGVGRKSILKELMVTKTGNPPNTSKYSLDGGRQQKSELEIYLKQNIQKNLHFIATNNSQKETIQWLHLLVKYTTNWDLDSLFCVSVWTDWQKRIMTDFPAIKLS